MWIGGIFKVGARENHENGDGDGHGERAEKVGADG